MKWFKTASEVAARYDITVKDICGERKVRHIAWPRQEVFAALYATGRYSLPKIGLLLNKDHTTVLYGIRAFERRQKTGVSMETHCRHFMRRQRQKRFAAALRSEYKIKARYCD